MAWSTSKSLGTSENLSQSTNTDVWSDVNSAGNGGSSGVHPVSVIRSEFLKSGSLDDVSPLKAILRRILCMRLRTFGISNLPWVFKCLA